MSSKASTDVALAVRGLSKRYRIARSSRHQATTLSESLLSAFRGGKGETVYTDFWAVRDVSFDLHEGDVVGVVGRNGAGKSTLLKLLSRITEPTEGEIDLYGRVGSLLEVGTGFHPELTGRENIFLNGAILGMTRPEIARQFDAIVEFAEIEQFLDTPVKRYSSGMYVRLAFAVAAHLNPEILIVDEVLAVGDAAFQRKCLGKMQDVAKTGGRTVLFVSHNMAAVRTLCNRALFMKQGQLILDDATEVVTDLYIAEAETAPAEVYFPADRSPSPDFHFIAGRVLDKNGEVAPAVDCRDPFTVEIEYAVVGTRLSNLRVGFGIQTPDGVLLCRTYDPDWSDHAVHAPGRYVARCRYPGHTLNQGTFLIGFHTDIPNDRTLQRTDYVLSFQVEDVIGHGADAIKLDGLIRPQLDWEGAISQAGQ